MTQNQCIIHANKSRERPDSHKYLEVWQFQCDYQYQLVLGKINVLAIATKLCSKQAQQLRGRPFLPPASAGFC